MSFSFWPKTIFQTHSKISGEIKVKEQFGQYTLQVQNLTQSGGIIKSIWQKPLKKVTKAERVLILGLGGGTVVQLIKKHFPQAEITGIEIDPEIIKIGKKYFGLGEIKNLRIIQADAFQWIKNYSGKKFGLILVDLYLGNEIAQEAMKKEFLKKLKGLLAKRGMIVFNWLKSKEVKEMEEKFSVVFSGGESLDLRTNLFLIYRHEIGDRD